MTFKHLFTIKKLFVLSVAALLICSCGDQKSDIPENGSGGQDTLSRYDAEFEYVFDRFRVAVLSDNPETLRYYTHFPAYIGLSHEKIQPEEFTSRFNDFVHSYIKPAFAGEGKSFEVLQEGYTYKFNTCINRKTGKDVDLPELYDNAPIFIYQIDVNVYNGNILVDHFTEYFYFIKTRGMFKFVYWFKCC